MKKNCSVKLDFKNGKSIERFRKYSELGGSGFRIYDKGVYQEELDKGNRDAAQKSLENLIGINFQNFTRTVALADDMARNFVSATSQKRRQTIEELLGFGKFEQYLVHTRTLHREIKSNIQLKQQDISHLQENLQSSHSRIHQFLESQHKAREEISALENRSDSSPETEIDEIQSEISRLQEQIILAKENATVAERVLQFRGIFREFQQQDAQCIAEMSQYQVSLSNLLASRTTNEIQDEIERLKSKLSLHFQAIESSLKKIIPNTDEYSALLASLQSDKSAMDSIIQKITEKCSSEEVSVKGEESEAYYEEQIQKITERRNSIQIQFENEMEDFFRAFDYSKEEFLKIAEEWDDNECQAHQRYERNLQETLQALQSKISNQESSESLQASVQISVYQREVELFEKLITQEREEIESIEQQIRSLEKDVASLRGKQESIYFWELAFGKAPVPDHSVENSGRVVYSMRDYVFQDSLKELNLTLRQSLEYLCDDGVHYHDLDTSLDSNFAFTGSEYGKRSSGERRRTALALFFALVELTRARSTHQTQFVILDEIFDALDESGQDAAHKLIQRLHEGSTNHAGIRKVFVITHSPVTAGLCHTLKVKKSPTGGTMFHPYPLWQSDSLPKE